jgi:hypothetical protein
MEATCSPETSVGLQRTTRRYIPKDSVRFKVFTAMIVTAVLLWVMTSYSFAGGFRRFGERRHFPPKKTKLNSVVLVREGTMPTERPPLVGEVVPTFGDRGCRVVSATDFHGRYLDFLDRSRYFFFQVAPQLSSRGWTPFQNRCFSENLETPGIELRTSGSVARNSDR